MAELDLEQRQREKSQGSQHGESWTAAPRGSAQPRPFGRTLAGRGRRRRDLSAQRDWHRRKRGISRSELVTAGP